MLAWGLTRETPTGLVLAVATAVLLVQGARREWAWAKARRSIEVFRAFVRTHAERWTALAALPKDAEGQPYPSPGLLDDPALSADLAVYAASAGSGERFRPRTRAPVP